MFIHPISVAKNDNKNFNKANLQNKNLSFTAKNPEVLRNQLKSLLTLDIWEPKLAVRLPKSVEEKETVLEVLHNRMNLDRFTRLSNERFNLSADISYAHELMQKEPNSPILKELLHKLDKKGNLSKLLDSLDSQIATERKKKAHYLDYFQKIDDTTEEYLDKKLIKTNQMSKFFADVKKNNINKNGQYSTQDLIEIIEKHDPNVAETGSKIASHNLSKKDLALKVSNEYESELRHSVDIYLLEGHHNLFAKMSRNHVEKVNQEHLAKFPEIKHKLPKIYSEVEKVYQYKVDKITGVDIYPIGEIWKDMSQIENRMRELNKSLVEIEQKIQKDPNNLENKILKSSMEEELYGLRDDWKTAVRFSVDYEAENSSRMAKAGCISEYKYLTEFNPIIAKHKKAYELMDKNNGDIPPESWKDFI